MRSARIAVAEAPVRSDADPAALDLFAAERDERNEGSACRAARAPEPIGEKVIMP